MVGPVAKRVAVGWLLDTSLRRACRVVGLSTANVAVPTARPHRQRRAPGASAGPRCGPASVWVPLAAHADRARRRARQSQTGASGVSRGRSSGPPAATETSHTRRAGAVGVAQRAAAALVDRLHGRHACRWPRLPHAEHRGRLHARVCRHRSRSLTAWRPCRPRASGPRPRPPSSTRSGESRAQLAACLVRSIHAICTTRQRPTQPEFMVPFSPAIGPRGEVHMAYVDSSRSQQVSDGRRGKGNRVQSYIRPCDQTEIPSTEEYPAERIVGQRSINSS